MKKLLAPGGNGQVGSYVKSHAESFGFNVYSPDLPEIDITNPDLVSSVFTHFMPDIVINCAAYTAVDKAETERSLAASVNVDGPRILAAHCAPMVPLLHVSTDYVFDGKVTAPYTEDHPPAPVNVYGETKWQGEVEALKAHAKTVILRTAWVYSPTHPNFLRTMIRLGKERNEISVVNDQRGTPTHAEDIALVLLAMAQEILRKPLKEENFGIFHYTAEGETTWHGFAAVIFDEMKRVTGETVDLHEVSTAAYPTPARRAHYTGLSTDKIKRVYGLSTQPWEPRVRETVRIALENESKLS